MAAGLRRVAFLGLIGLLLSPAWAQSTDDGRIILTGTVPAVTDSGTVVSAEPSTPTGTYATYTTKVVLGPDGPRSDDGNSTTDGVELVSLTGTRTLPPSSLAPNATSGLASSATLESPLPTNTRPCNGHVEFCTRRYSNVTYVAAHNSPFVREGSVAANQEHDTTAQLNDGVRLLQAQMHMVDGVPRLCHSSCDILDAGPLADWLAGVKAWVDAHPFDVVAVLIGNGGYDDPAAFVPAIESTGILRYAYVPPYLPMALADWPTLAEMIILGKRVVFFLDYQADQARYPWLLDEFGQMWETPFDPEDRSFPCVPQRPPNLPDDQARARLYMINHNLNVNFRLLGTEILVPARNLLNETNAASGNGSLGQSAEACRADWGRPPNFLNVDYYNYGSSPGSVFEVAAAMNGVDYTGRCCGIDSAAAVAAPSLAGLAWLAWAVWWGL